MSGKNSQAPKGLKVGTGRMDNDQREGAESERKTLTVEEAGRILGISRGAAYARAEDGSIPTIRLGKRLLVPKAALDKLLMTA
jgi:excisionase family DNA binding protein